MSRVLVIGIDSLDMNLLSAFEKELPVLTGIRRERPEIRLTSVFPPDSETAWATIYTGLNPARHGILYFVDPIERAQALNYEEAGSNALPLQGNTFWDIASRHGKKVCILFPHIVYPAWPVNGTMLVRTTRKDTRRFPVQSFPSSLAQSQHLSHLNTLRGYPQNIIKYVEQGKRLLLGEAELGLRMLKEGEWDLFFIYSSVLDWMSHHFWRYWDKDDPSYPGDSPYKNVIADFYRLHDEIVGRFLEAAPPDTAIIVLSDHGHGRRPTQLLNINELLRQKGLLVPKIKRRGYHDPYYVLERLKEVSSRIVNKYRLGGNLALRLMTLLPGAKKMYTTPLSIDWDKTVAYVSDLSGIKAYSYGGIIVKREGLKGAGYEEVRTSIIQEIAKVKGQDSNAPLAKWVSRREDLYQGPYISRYPDVVFELRAEYGAGWATHERLVTPCYTHNIHPGNHRLDGAALLLRDPRGRSLTRREATLMDIAPTILQLLEIEGESGRDGQSLLG